VEKANLKRPEKTEDDEAQNKKDESEEKSPQVQLTTFQNWDDVGRWYISLERDRIVPDDKIRAKAAELVRDSKTDQEKVEALYAFVARNVRYVSLSFGEGRYQPHGAPEVLANQYGDCKDKHTLLSSMLLAAGLRAYPALMNSSRKIDVDVPSPAQFDHVISVIPLGAQMLWADTTAEVAPFRLLASPLRDKKALVVPANEPARLETTPAVPPFLSSEVVEIEGQVSDLGKLSAHSHLTLRGDSELLFRIMFRRTPRSDWKQLGYYLTMLTGVRGDITEIKPSEPAATEKAFEVEYDISQDDFFDWSSKKAKVRIPLPGLNLGNIQTEGKDNSKPIQVGPPIQVTYRLKLSLPSKYQTSVPLPLTVNRDYANYSSSYSLQGNTLVVERILNMRQHELPTSRLQDFQAFVAATRANEAQTLTVETEIAGTPAIPGSVKVEELVQAAEAAAKNQNYLLVEELLKRVLEKEPKHKEARRQLAWALFGQHKFDDAISVLREQIKINPFDDYSYNLMGRVFWRQQKYAEAEDSFRRQIEITPLDQDAHGNLGQLLVEWRKYKEAVPELEKATSLNPEGEMLFVSLGRAYLNLGEIEKATRAFDKAVKLAPGPLVWNDVSYNLALSKVQLDKALQYAESEVTQVATELRNIELQRMTLRDLYGVMSLAAYWDTLGWVHFQKGDLESAEKYVSASWALSQHSEVGYHLGQINERLDKKEAAIHMYALAAVAGRLVPEARESLDKLVGKDKSEALMRKADDEMRDIRTIKLSPLTSNVKQSTAEAQFYVVLVPGASRNAQVAEVKFIRGDEKLRPLGEALKGVNYNFVFPDESTTKVVRRGTLFCQAGGGGCSFIMMNPEFIPSID
jgi:tetratricopeptide (TPR) repeat protein